VNESLSFGCVLDLSAAASLIGWHENSKGSATAGNAGVFEDDVLSDEMAARGAQVMRVDRRRQGLPLRLGDLRFKLGKDGRARPQ